MKIAVAAAPYPTSLQDGLHWVEKLIKDAAAKSADIICFPESYLPGYPSDEFHIGKYSQAQLQVAFEHVCSLAAQNNIALIIPMDWYSGDTFLNVAHVISRSGKPLGYQTKNQLDPSEDTIWKPGNHYQIFEINGVKIGVVICHEGFRYPESVRWMARQGAQVVFHPNYTGSRKPGIELKEWGSKENPYYEKAQMMRAMENTIYVASSNYAVPYPESASAIIDPEGNCLASQTNREPGIAVAEINLEKATGLLAKRFKPQLHNY
jgi:predicted amidohydrolase